MHTISDIRLGEPRWSCVGSGYGIDYKFIFRLRGLGQV